MLHGNEIHGAHRYGVISMRGNANVDIDRNIFWGSGRAGIAIKQRGGDVTITNNFLGANECPALVIKHRRIARTAKVEGNLKNVGNRRRLHQHFQLEEVSEGSSSS